MQVATIASLAWGALAFGAVYPWAYRPLTVVCLVTGLAAMGVARSQGVPSRPLLVTLVLVWLAIGVQLVPIPADILAAVSPVTIEAVRALDVRYAVGLTSYHPISISPPATAQGLVFVFTFAVFAVGLARFLSVYGVRWLAESIVVLGLLLAIVGLVQKSVFGTEIYGFWTPIAKHYQPFGPYVNRNHFAGWMLMALPVVLSFLLSKVTRGMHAGVTTWRDRVLWLGSPAASGQLLTGVSAMVMGLSLVLTMSRSGMVACVLAVVICALFVSLSGSSRASRTIALGYLGAFLIVVVGWAGSDLIATRFLSSSESLSFRFGTWSDAWRISSMFPWTGTGLNTYSSANSLYQQHDLTLHYAQAHNDYLQLLAEGGVLVFVPVLVLVAFFCREVLGRYREPSPSVTSWWLRTGAVVGLVAIAAQEVVDFSLQMPGNAALFAVLCAIAIHRAPAMRTGVSR